MREKNDIEQLGDIFQKLNHGISIDSLSIKEMEFLCKFYGENWYTRVLDLLEGREHNGKTV